MPFGFAAIARQASERLPEVSVLHIFAAVMTRATRGRTGRKLKSSRMTNISYALLGSVALVRPLAELVPALNPRSLPWQRSAGRRLSDCSW
ncbi:NnrS family protein [Rhizobium sp. WYJ-E13]|uniref:NnrS family protein n=1 Tax=Rhizobium sp. WYJ-E13 TaxID=2849093 RepID=UPI0020A793EE|nr:NnrS family protein [Rhizobium sp. WYJ-E13]